MPVRFFASRDRASDLALFRIAVFAALALESLAPCNRAAWYAGLPPELQVLPAGYGWLAGPLPLRPAVVEAVAAAHLLFCALACLGLRTRLFCAAAAVSGFVVLGIPHLFDGPGRILIHHHHLIWFAALLAASRCGDAWSLDALRLGQPPPPASAAYSIPRRLAWILIGLIYFFPGLWKAAAPDAVWWTGEALLNSLRTHWWITGETRGDWAVPRPLAAAAGIGVVLFELSFLPMILASERTRRAAVAAGLVFHASTAVLMRLSFWPLVACYAVFFGTGPARDDSGGDPVRAGAARPAWIIGGFLIAVNALCGALRIDSWPFAVYPTFEKPGPGWLRTIRIRAFDRDGRAIPVPVERVSRRFGAARWHRMLERIAARPDRAEPLCRALWAVLAREDASLRAAVRVEFDSVEDRKTVRLCVLTPMR